MNEGNMHERAWQPILNNTHPGRKIANAQLPSMTLELLVHLAEDPLWHKLLPDLKALFSKYSGRPSVPRAHAAAAQHNTPPAADVFPGGVRGDVADSSAPSHSSSPASPTLSPTACTQSAAVKVSSVRATPLPVSAVTYAAAAATEGVIYKKATVGMVNAHAWLNADESCRRDFFVDDGCNLSCMSEEAFAKDQSVLMQTGRICELAKPLSVAMIDGQSIEATKLVKGLTFSIGVAKYTADFLVIPMPGIGYILGADFLSKFDVSKDWRNGLLRMGVVKDSVLPIVKQAYRPYQTVPMRRARGHLPLHLK